MPDRKRVTWVQVFPAEWAPLPLMPEGHFDVLMHPVLSDSQRLYMAVRPGLATALRAACERAGWRVEDWGPEGWQAFRPNRQEV